MRVALTLSIFIVVLSLVVVRPRRWNEAWWTMLGAALMIALRLVSPQQAVEATRAGKNPLLFLLSLLGLSLLIGHSGFFDWSAIHCARIAKRDARALYRNTFVLGALITAVLSLDTTAVILTPVVLALVKKLKLPASPYIVLCAFVANVGSLALPISNLTNILFSDAFQLTFVTFAARMILPQLVALFVTYGLLRWNFRAELPKRFDDTSLPDPMSVVPSRAYFSACVVVLGVVLVGYFVAPLLGVEAYVIAFAGCGVLTVAGAATKRVQVRDLAEISWGVFPFVIGLFIAVQAIENLGIVTIASDWLERLPPGSPAKLLVASAVTAFASNLMNNLPTALIARSILVAAHADTATMLATLVGADVGPMITPFGSLATMLVFALARRAGEEVQPAKTLLLGLWTVPIIVLATTLSVLLVFSVFR